MLIRKDPLINNQIYHILNRSIAGFVIFNDESDFLRFMESVKYYQYDSLPMKFSQFIRLPITERNKLLNKFSEKEKLVKIITFCVMPTHPHLILEQLKDGGTSIFMSNLENSYARYFNTKYKRKGPLWEGRFKNIIVKSERQLYHLTRYIHLNPVTAGIVEKPEEWIFTSYHEYLNKNDRKGICEFEEILSIRPEIYRKFVEDRISYQRQLFRIKKLILEQRQPYFHLVGGNMVRHV